MGGTGWMDARPFAVRWPPTVGASSGGDGSPASPACGVVARAALPAGLWPVVLGALLALLTAALSPTPALAATKTWSGLGGDANWTTPGNWVGAVAPVANDDLVFPVGASQLTNNNDFPAGTTFNSIVIQAAGYTLNGNSVAIAASGNVTANVAGAATITIPIQGTGGVTKSGTGVLTLAGANTYTGPTAVTAGTLLVNGSQSTGTLSTVSAGATLGGTGTAGPVTTSGTVSPGVNGPGILNSGAVSFSAGSTFAVELNGTAAGSGYDRLIAAGTVLLGGNAALNVTVGFPSAAGNTYTIIQSLTVVAGTFNGLPNGATLSAGGRTFVITYTTNTVVLTDTTPTLTPTGTPTAASSPTGTPTAATSPTGTPTAASSPTGTPTAASTPTGTPTAASSPTGTPTAASSPTGTPTAASSPTGAPTPTPTPAGVPTNQNVPPSTGQPGTPCALQVGAVCSISGANEHGTWTRIASGVFTVFANGPTGALVGGLPAIFLSTTTGVEGLACGPVTATLQTTCTGGTVGNLLLGATVTVRFPLVGGGTVDVTGTVAAPSAVATPAVPVTVLVNPPLLPPPLPIPPPASLPLLPPPPGLLAAPLPPPLAPAPVAPSGTPPGAGAAAEVPVIPEGESGTLLGGSLLLLAALVGLRAWRRRNE